MSKYNDLLTFKLGMESKIHIEVDLSEAKRTALIYRAINHKLRQQILRLIEKSDNMTVTQIQITLRLEQPTTSLHLSVLRKAGFIKPHRNGKAVYYNVNKERMAALNQSMAILLK